MNAMAGLDGYGHSSYINDVVLRDRDNTSGWLAASDGTLEERYYLCPNWRGDMSVLVHHQRYTAEWVKYSPYGIPFGLPGGDANSDGDNDATDATQIQAWIDAPAYDVRGDVDLDGDVDSTDKALAQTTPLASNALAWKSLSDDAFANRRGNGGYERIGAESMCHVRNRILAALLGTWLQRDSFAPHETENLYEYAQGNPILRHDATGLRSQTPDPSGTPPQSTNLNCLTLTAVPPTGTSLSLVGPCASDVVQVGDCSIQSCNRTSWCKLAVCVGEYCEFWPASCGETVLLQCVLPDGRNHATATCIARPVTR